MIKFISVFFVVSLIFISQAISDPNHMPAVEGSKEFNKIKFLIGKWEGKSEMG